MSGSRRRGSRRRRSDSDRGVGGQKSTRRTLTDPSTGQERTFDMTKEKQRKEYMGILRQYHEKAKQETGKGRNRLAELIAKGKIPEYRIWQYWQILREERINPRTKKPYRRKTCYKYLAEFINGYTGSNISGKTVQRWMEQHSMPLEQIATMSVSFDRIEQERMKEHNLRQMRKYYTPESKKKPFSLKDV